MSKPATNNAIRSLSCFAFLGLFVAATTLGCGDDATSKSPACFLGDERTCTAVGGCVGVQTCYADGWDDCICASVTPDAGTPDSGTADSGTPTRPLLGGVCSADTECPSNAMCLLPSSTAWFGGGPPKGLCVAECTNDPAVCAAFEAAVCVNAAPAGTSGAQHAFCLPACDTTTGTPADAACGHVPSSACELLDGQTAAFCRPFCARDSDCASGHCDHRYGSCVASAPLTTGVGFGQTCDPNAANCDGVCVNLANGSYLCTQRCTIGSTEECSPEASTLRSSVCSYAATAAPHPGNIGYCAPLCNCNDDCASAGLVCRAFTEADTQSRLGRPGMCYPPVDSTGKAESGVVCQ